MKRLRIVTVWLLVLCAPAAWSTERTPLSPSGSSGTVKPTRAAPAGPEPKAIGRTIEDAARAMSDLPRSRDPRSVLRFYSPDYRGITDGEWQDRTGLESVVAEIDENVRVGHSVKIVNRATDVQASAEGVLGWATYDFYSKIEVLGEVLGEVERRCTGVYRKDGASWLIRHEHCSTTWAAAPTGDDPADDSPDGGVEG